MADPFRVEPKGKSWADIVEEDEQYDLLDSQHEESPSAFKEELNEEPDAALADAHAASATSSSDQQADSNKDSIASQEPPKVEDKPVLTGSRASKWASAPSEPRGQSKWQSSSSSAAANASKGGSMASKWANAPDSSPRSRYDSNYHTRHDSYNRFGDHGRNNDSRRNDRWREDPPSGGRLNRSAFEDNDVRNGGFTNRANFSREKRYQEYHELTSKEAVNDEAPEHKNAIESWNAYKPPAEENEETAKQLVEAANEIEQPSTDQTTKEEQQNASNAQEEGSKETNVSPTKTVEPVKPPTVSSSPSLKPVSSFSWADDIPDDNSDDDGDYPIPADWITPKRVVHASTAQAQEVSTTPQATENDIKESTTNDSSVKPDLETAADARNPPSEEVAPELSQSTKGTDPVDTTTTTAAAAAVAAPSEATATTSPTEASKEERHAYTWGALNDYKEPETTIPKADDFAKINKEQEEAAVAAWNSLKLPEEPEEEVTASTTKEKELLTTQGTEEQPSWNQSAVPSWDQADKEQSNGAMKTQQQQQQPIPEPKPAYIWGALDDYKEPELIAKPKPDIVCISKEDEEAAVSAWNSVKLPEEPETTEEKPQEPVRDTPSWNTTAQEPEPAKAEPSWNATFVEPSWNNTDAQVTSWSAVDQPSWSEHSANADSNTSQPQQQDWATNSFQEGSSVTSKSSFKDTWRNKLPMAVDDNAGGWKSFVETVAVPPEPAPKQTVKESATAVPHESPVKRTEKGSTASKWSHDRYSGAESSHPRPSQRKPHDLSFKLNDFKKANDNEVHVSWKDIQAQDNPKISIKDDTSDRQATVNLSEFSQTNPQQDIVLRLSDLTSGRALDSAQHQQQHQGPLEVTLSFSELNKGRNEASAASASNYSSSGPKEIVCKLSDFAKKDEADGPLDISLKLF